MKEWKSHFRFNRQERSGIFFLLLFIFLFQLTFYFVKYTNLGTLDAAFVHDTELQQQIDSLMALKEQKKPAGRYPVNPNYLTDYRGYEMGMSLQEIDRLYNFRKQGHFVNSISEFQEITGVSDSLLKELSGSLRFPQWRYRSISSVNAKVHGTSVYQKTRSKKEDLNQASAEDLRKIRGIGNVLSNRILKFREALGGFLVDEQLYDVYGLDEVVARRVLDRYTVLQKPNIEKLNLQYARSDQLSRIVYLSNKIARRIVHYRDSVKGFDSIDELTKIQDFPKEQIERIKLYLTL